ncbi:ArsR/SmtB family transcription factor [Nannocystis radixulma]|uniref:Metalloregulator ArsR/SmtB family transcription factor n=1 Tax=Nannocystis radixulma TaxID=2995305 RepID=A0ABT5B0E7_9BACT|nr:metalloregulator ArsR/SmtB family transcription factor [Nannocystis radixulma]MDC0666652.1 metalloregulator ArsR/SmtB family transcription factor [Nannocystis radixulma]
MTCSTSAATLDAVFFALSDNTRRGLLERLRGVEENAGTLARGFAVTRPAVSRHLRILREAELVVEHKRGRERVYTLAPERLAVATEWLDTYRVFWSARLRDLKTLVESLPPDDPPEPAPSPTRTRRSRSTR